MNPNSQHQLWSKWTVGVKLPYAELHSNNQHFEYVKLSVALFFRREFGSVGQARVRHNVEGSPSNLWSKYVCEIRCEGKPAHDPDYYKLTRQRLKNYFRTGFGNQAQITIDMRVEAGDLQDGDPAHQLLILPSIGL